MCIPSEGQGHRQRGVCESQAAFSLRLRENNFTAMAGEQFVSL